MLLAERARAARLEDILKLINLTTFYNCSEDFLADQFALALEDQHLALGKAYASVESRLVCRLQDRS